MEIQVSEKDINNKIDELRLKGWMIDNIEKYEYYKIKLTRMSNFITYKNSDKIPFLRTLRRPMIINICNDFKIKVGKRSINELIFEIEKYKKSAVMEVYENIVNKDIEKFKESCEISY